MKKILKLVLSYLLISFNTFVLAIENKESNVLKIGILAPLSGELKSLGEEIIYSANLAIHDIDSSNIKIYPKDSGSNHWFPVTIKTSFSATSVYTNDVKTLLRLSPKSIIINES